MPLIDECFQLAAGKAGIRICFDVIDLRLRHSEQAKDPVGCRQTAAIWESLKRTDAGSLYQSAALRAVAGSVSACDQPVAGCGPARDTEADLAMAWLNQAVAAGFEDAAHLMRDSDLNSLHSREDFKKLVGGLHRVRERHRSRP